MALSYPLLAQPNGGAIPSGTVLPPPCAVCGGTASVPPVTEALVEDGLAVGERVWLLPTDGMHQHVRPYQIRAIDHGPDGHRYARFAEMCTRWLLAQCTRAALWCAKIGAARISAQSSERPTLIGRDVGQPIRPGHDRSKRGQSVWITVVNSA